MKIGDTLVAIKGFTCSKSGPFRINISSGTRLQITECSAFIKAKQSGGKEVTLTHQEVQNNLQVSPD
jgi:hypothetical protein